MTYTVTRVYYYNLVRTIFAATISLLKPPELDGVF